MDCLGIRPRNPARPIARHSAPISAKVSVNTSLFRPRGPPCRWPDARQPSTASPVRDSVRAGSKYCMHVCLLSAARMVSMTSLTEMLHHVVNRLDRLMIRLNTHLLFFTILAMRWYTSRSTVILAVGARLVIVSGDGRSGEPQSTRTVAAGYSYAYPVSLWSDQSGLFGRDIAISGPNTFRRTWSRPLRLPVLQLMIVHHEMPSVEECYVAWKNRRTTRPDGRLPTPLLAR